VFDLYQRGQLLALIDTGRAFKGVASIPAAVDYMLQGGHTGKVVAQLHGG
jgi:NADPH-dependent curcumin reductase CurA